MQTVGMFEAKAKLSELVKSGEVITITSHRKPVARLVPVREFTPEFMAELKRQAKLVSETEDKEEDDYWMSRQDLGD